jgi:predicted metal-dependent enzyme (double-stranded beta helix superfamily)
VMNPGSSYTGAIHIYGGDFFTEPRSEFDPGTLEEQPYDVARTMALFDQG